MQRLEIDTAAGRFSALQWGSASADAPRLHFAHATGMNAGLYARLLAPLADRYRILASDARGHGRTAALRPGAVPGDQVAWDDFAGDLLSLVDAVDPHARWLLAGHSMGGTTSLLAAVQRPDRVAGLVLLDPPFIPFAIARAARASRATIPNPMADQAGRRRADFADVATARAAWHGRGVFRDWANADLDAYLADGLLPSDDGVTLACAPAWEAATFRGVTLDFEPALQSLERPFALIAGEHGSTVPAAEFAIIAAHPRCLRAERLAGTSHFVPLQRPDAVAAAIDAVAAAA
ncbi:MAG: alpha/beta hydrolase [Alphaproteobacteria bacterium]|nr:MAG: alpha/beta hydrolase [Alphaproteobacteria bacterium]